MTASEYRLVVAVSNPASVVPLTRMGCALARANQGSLVITSITEVPAQVPLEDSDDLVAQQEAIVEEAVSIADSVGMQAEGKAPPSHSPAQSVVSLVADTDAAGLLLGAGELAPFKESLLRSETVERMVERAPCDVYVEQIGPAPTEFSDSVLVPIADGAHAATVARVASDIASVHDMRVRLVRVVEPDAGAGTLDQREQELQTYLTTDIDVPGEVLVLPSSDTVETLVDLTGEHDVTVVGATAESPLKDFLSGTVPTGLAKRTRNTLLMVDSHS